MKLVAIAEIGTQVGRPLVGFRQEHGSGEFGINSAAQIFENRVRLRQVFAGCPFPFDQVGNGIQAETVHADCQPEFDDLP